MALKHRIEKLEKQAGVDDQDSPVIGYCCFQKDGRVSAEAARRKATEKWEAKNGPLGDREPLYIERWIVLNPVRAQTNP